jgi:hypothetical protein
MGPNGQGNGQNGQGNGQGGQGGYGQGNYYPWGQYAGAFGAGLGDYFAGGKNPADAANPYFNKIPGVLQGAYNPYMQAGQGALGALGQQYGQLLNNPGGFINSVGKNFQQSPGYQFQVDQSTRAAQNAANAGGMAGSVQNQQQVGGIANQLANQDYYNYLGNALGQYDQGLQGEQGIAGMGFNAANEYANSMGANLMNQGNLAYAGQINQNQQRQGTLGSIFGGLGGLFGGMFGGGQGGYGQGQGDGQGGNSGNGLGWLSTLAGLGGDLAGFFA